MSATGHVDVEQHAALQTMHMVVSVDATVVTTRLIRERQLLDKAMLSQEMQVFGRPCRTQCAGHDAAPVRRSRLP